MEMPTAFLLLNSSRGYDRHGLPFYTMKRILNSVSALRSVYRLSFIQRITEILDGGIGNFLMKMCQMIVLCYTPKETWYIWRTQNTVLKKDIIKWDLFNISTASHRKQRDWMEIKSCCFSEKQNLVNLKCRYQHLQSKVKDLKKN